MRLKRTFHPVGHGAFYTEKFLNDNSCEFVAVYDCGSLSMNSSQLEKVIDKAFKQVSKIDVLFISHFHADHVNGIPHLLELCNVDKVIIPAYTKLQLAILYIHNAIECGNVDNEANKLLDRMYYSSLNSDLAPKIIKVEPANRESRLEEMNEDSFEKITTISKIVDDTISSGTYLRSDEVPFWTYIPYNLHQFGKGDIIKDFFKKTLGVLSETGDVDKENLKKLLKKKNIKIVREAYKKAIDKDPNQHSMTLYSGQVFFKNNPSICWECCHHYPCYLCLDHCEKHCSKAECIFKQHYFWECKNPICLNFLYTGDFVASEDNVNSLITFYDIYFRISKSIQVPHHCSSNVGDGKKYGTDLFKCCWNGIVSTQFGQFPNLPANDTILKILKKRVTPLFLTKSSRTMLDIDYNL